MDEVVITLHPSLTGLRTPYENSTRVAHTDIWIVSRTICSDNADQGGKDRQTRGYWKDRNVIWKVFGGKSDLLFIALGNIDSRC